MPNTLESDYRRLFPVIDLPANGRVPSDLLTGLSISERDAWIGVIGDASAAVESIHGRRQVGPRHALPTEIARAWRLWLAGHHAFFPIYALLAHTYDEMVSAEEEGRGPALAKSTRHSIDLNRCAGALLAAGMDFTPTMEIYEGHIRPSMPEAFSGHWLREAVAVSESRRRWTDIVPAEDRTIQAKRDELRGRGLYDKYHRTVMQQAVSDGRSLANAYRHRTGCALVITDQEFANYDEWFRVRRVQMSRLEFVNVTCRAVRMASESVVTGSRLGDAAVRDLVTGLETALAVMCEWFGPVREASLHYHKAYRGE